MSSGPLVWVTCRSTPTILVEKLLLPDLMTDKEYCLMSEERNPVRKTHNKFLLFCMSGVPVTRVALPRRMVFGGALPQPLLPVEKCLH
jgi:hypothetical protein